MRYTLVLPAYNEEKSLPALLDRVKETFAASNCECSVLVVDDGSKDGTVQVAESYQASMPLRIYKHPQNMGLGAAIKNGLREGAADMGDSDVVVTMDADNTHDPALIPQMLAKIESGCELVIASRYAPGGEEIGLAPHRKVLSRGASTFLKTFFGIPGARDCSCGFRAYRVSLLRRAFETYGDKLVEETGFVCMAEVLVKLAMIGAKIDEVPLILRYDLKEGASKMKVGKTIGQYFALAKRKNEIKRMAQGQSARE
jgi:dolichol-phosphate mannosyltransferase